MKDVCSQGGGRFVQYGHFADKGEGVLQMRTSALFGAKNFGFFEIYDVPAQTRRVEPVRTFCGQGGEEVNFSRFCADVFHGRPLMSFFYSNYSIFSFVIA